MSNGGKAASLAGGIIGGQPQREARGESEAWVSSQPGLWIEMTMEDESLRRLEPKLVLNLQVLTPRRDQGELQKPEVSIVQLLP